MPVVKALKRAHDLEVFQHTQSEHTLNLSLGHTVSPSHARTLTGCVGTLTHVSHVTQKAESIQRIREFTQGVVNGSRVFGSRSIHSCEKEILRRSRAQLRLALRMSVLIHC